MHCEDKNIKDILPAYRDEALDKEEQLQVEQHLHSCADCRRELALLRLMSEDSVPDPGAAFWSTMPARIFRAVQDKQNKKQLFDFVRFRGLLVRYRLTAVAATVGIVVILAWFTVLPPSKVPEVSLSERYEFADEIMATDTEPAGNLDSEELEIVGNWANTQLASLSEEVASMPVNVINDADIPDQIAELDAAQIERLSSMIEQ